MTQKKQDLEDRAAALLARLQRHNLAGRALTEFEIKGILKEIRTIRKQNLGGSFPADALERIDRIMEQAVAEAKNNAAVILVRGTGA